MSSCQNAYVAEELKETAKTLEKLKTRKKNIINAIADGLMEDDFSEILSQIKADEALLTARREKLSVKSTDIPITEEDLKGMIAEFSDYVLNRNIPECKKFISQFVEQVIVYDTKIEVSRCTLPLSEDIANLLLNIKSTQNKNRKKYGKTI